MNKFHTAMALLALAGSASIAVADGEEEEEAHADIAVLIDPAGNLVTGTIDFDEQEFTGFTRVYESEFVRTARPDLGVGIESGNTDEPGFNGVRDGNLTLPAGYSNIGAGLDLSFSVNTLDIDGTSANLWYWDGSGAVNFAPATTTLDVSRGGGALNTSLDGSASAVPGFNIFTSEADGYIHQHLDLELANTQGIADGFFLWSFVVETSDGKAADPIFFVHGLGEPGEELHEEAVDWVNFNLVPAPGAAVFAFAGVGALVRRRRA